MSRRRTETGSARTALERLVDACAAAVPGWTVELKRRRGEKMRRLVVTRPGRPRVVFSPHKSAQNYALLRDIARFPVELGGCGLPLADIVTLTGYREYDQSHRVPRRRRDRAQQKA